jgi:hypothetical protein
MRNLHLALLLLTMLGCSTAAQAHARLDHKPGGGQHGCRFACGGHALFH